MGFRGSAACPPTYFCFSSQDEAQAAAARVDQDELTVPGAPPGIYACAYRELAAILALLAEGRLALARGDHAGAQVATPSIFPKRARTMGLWRCVLGGAWPWHVATMLPVRCRLLSALHSTQVP